MTPNPIDLEAIHKRADAATPGPWHHDGGKYIDSPHNAHTPVAKTFDNQTNYRADAEFIAHAREDIPALLTEVERLRDFKAAWNPSFEECESDREIDRTRIAELEAALEDACLNQAQYGIQPPAKWLKALGRE